MKTSRENPMLAKAWVNFNGTGTVAINDSFNVTSITDDGAGAYIINFTISMADANYSSFGFSRRSGATGIVTEIRYNETYAAASYHVNTRNLSNTATDCDIVCTGVFGGQ